MTIVEKQHSINGDVNRVWEVLADFGNFLVWATGGRGTAQIEGEGVGMIRHLDIPGLGQVSERLDQLDTESMVLGYTMVSDAMAGMAKYSACVQLVDEGNGRSQLSWRGELEPEQGMDADEVGASLAGSYDMMAQGLEAYVATLD